MINMSKWKPLIVDDVFEIINGKGITKQEIFEHQGELPAVQSGEKNNGIIGYIDQEYCDQMRYAYTTEPCLTVARSGAAGFVTYQKKGCCVGDSAKILKPKEKFSTEVFLFFKTMLMANKYRYTYARKVTKDNYKTELIYAPVTKSGKLDYEEIKKIMNKLDGNVTSIPDYFLEEGYEKACWYMDNINQKDFENNYAGRINDKFVYLTEREWAEFHLYDLFHIDSGNKFDKSKMTNYLPTVNFVGRSSENNGVTACVDEIENIVPFKEGLLTVALGGEYLGSCFVQKYPFYTSQNVVVLEPLNEMSIYSKLFIANLIRYESANSYKAFARELNAHIRTDFSIKLPITEQQKPDFDFMDRYIQSLSFSGRLDKGK